MVRRCVYLYIKINAVMLLLTSIWLVSQPYLRIKFIVSVVTARSPSVTQTVEVKAVKVKGHPNTFSQIVKMLVRSHSDKHTHVHVFAFSLCSHRFCDQEKERQKTLVFNCPIFCWISQSTFQSPQIAVHLTLKGKDNRGAHITQHFNKKNKWHFCLVYKWCLTTKHMQEGTHEGHTDWKPSNHTNKKLPKNAVAG